MVPHLVEGTSIAMATVPHSRILIRVSPGARNGILLDRSLFPPVLTSEIKLISQIIGSAAEVMVETERK